jgi:ABC-type transport system substrate-binding protein
MRTKWLLIALPLVIFGVLLQSALWVPTYASQAKGNPQRLVTFLRGSIGDVKQLNPMIASDAGAGTIMDGNIFEGLVDADDTLKLIPKLAERWEVTEDAYLAVLPDRRLPTGNLASGAELLRVLEAARSSGQLGEPGTIRGLSLSPPEARQATETVLGKNAKGKDEPVDVEMTIDVPERVRIQLSKVEPELFQKLEAVVGASYFLSYPFEGRFKLKKPELLPQIRSKLPELLGIGEHNPIITFYLRKGIRWQDGHPLTAEDVKFTYQAIVNPKNTSPRASSFDPIKTVDVLDELTARVVYKQLYAPAIIDWAMGLIPKHLLEDRALAREMDERKLSPAERKTFSIRNSRFNENPVGTGPYRFAEWRKDQFIRLERFEGYWDTKPQYERLFFRVIPDYLTMELEFSAGALDMYDALPHQAERYRRDDRYQVLSSNEGVFSYIGYNMRREPFKDARVRRALGMAINVDDIIKYVLSGEGKRATGPYYSNTPYNDPDVKPLPYDPKAALELLAQAGWKKNAQGMLEKDGKPLAFTLVTNNGNVARKAIMTIAQEAWRRLGVDCKVQAFEWTVFLEDFVHNNNFDAYVLGWTGGDINPDKYQIWHSSQTDPYELNYVGFKNARADELIMKIRETYDQEQVVKMGRELHHIIAEEQPYTFLYEPLKPTVLDKRIAIVERGPDGREQVRKIQVPPSGAAFYHFYKFRKFTEVPQPTAQ